MEFPMSVTNRYQGIEANVVGFTNQVLERDREKFVNLDGEISPEALHKLYQLLFGGLRHGRNQSKLTNKRREQLNSQAHRLQNSDYGDTKEID